MRTTRILAAVALALVTTAPPPPARAAAPGAAAADLKIAVTARVSGKFVSPAGTEPPGFDVDLLRRFAAWHRVRTGREPAISYKYSPTVPDLLAAIQAGTADVGMGGVTATAERGKLVDFTLPTLPVRSVVIAPPGVLDPQRWRQQIKGLRLGATVGSTNAGEVGRVAAAIPGVVVKTEFKTNEAVFEALTGPTRSLDAAIVDLPQYWVTGKQKGLVLVDSVGQPQSMAFVLRKGSPLKANLDQFLGEYTHSSEYFQLIRKYFGQDAEKMVRMSRSQG